jgi:hypothetical protein
MDVFLGILTGWWVCAVEVCQVQHVDGAALRGTVSARADHGGLPAVEVG